MLQLIVKVEPRLPAEKIVIYDLASYINNMLGENIQQLRLADSIILYDGYARPRGEHINCIICGETIIGNLLCLKQYTPIPIGLDDDLANELMNYSCFQRSKPICMSKFLK